MIAEARAKPGALVAHRMQLIEVRLASADALFEFSDEAILAGVRCVSATDQMQIFPMPRFRQTCGSKYKSPCGTDPTSGAYRTTTNNNDQEDGSQKSQPDSKEFRSDGIERSAVTFSVRAGATIISL
jgi:Tfp pilus assembly protein PilP